MSLKRNVSLADGFAIQRTGAVFNLYPAPYRRERIIHSLYGIHPVIIGYASDASTIRQLAFSNYFFGSRIIPRHQWLADHHP